MKSSSQNKVSAIIPARYGSSRFPGKPLALIGGIPMIKRVHDQAARALDSVWVATDDQRIFDTVSAFGGKVVMTSADHRSGTDRCAEAASKISQIEDTDIIINIQGDEPFIRPEQIKMVAGCFAHSDVKLATLIREVMPGEDLFNPNQPKVVVASNGDALYFSRSAIPYFREAETSEWVTRHRYFKHLGIYGYRFETLLEITKLPHGLLENAELLEQNRWLENGYRIRTAVTQWESIGIDTQEDLKRAEELLKK
jgi:3-deoxy-manno-octulosonate cytidylyltransferase (CMP-KDO synthetase)